MILCEQVVQRDGLVVREAIAEGGLLVQHTVLALVLVDHPDGVPIRTKGHLECLYAVGWVVVFQRLVSIFALNEASGTMEVGETWPLVSPYVLLFMMR